VQRNLTSALSRLTVMSTLGIQPPGGCHYPAQGYAEMARLIAPLIDRDLHGLDPKKSITAPHLLRAAYGDSTHSELVLEFDQPVRWDSALVRDFWLDGSKDRIASGRTDGNRLVLTLHKPHEAKTITYLDSASWDPGRLLRGLNGIAALTFCEVPLETQKPTSPRKTGR
jgi:hypothetical protein